MEIAKFSLSIYHVSRASFKPIHKTNYVLVLLSVLQRRLYVIECKFRVAGEGALQRAIQTFGNVIVIEPNFN